MPAMPVCRPPESEHEAAAGVSRSVLVSPKVAVLSPPVDPLGVATAVPEHRPDGELAALAGGGSGHTLC